MISQISYAADRIKDTWAYLETILPVHYNEINRVVAELVTNNNATMSTVLAAVYPVGAIYLSTVVTSPATLFGGTWVQLKDTFLLGAGDTYGAGTTGGEATHTLTIAEMPHHKHSMTLNNYAYNAITANHGWGGDDVSNGAYTNETSYAGGDAAHNNMPPYLAVYVWKRTA